MIDELHKVMIKKLALNLAYHEIAPDFTHHVMKEAIKDNDITILDAIIGYGEACERALYGFETGEIDITEIVKEECLQRIVKGHAKNLIKIFKGSPKRLDNIFKDYTKYLNDKYPERV